MRLPAPFPVAALLLLAIPSLAAVNAGVGVRSGDRFTAAVDPAGDEDGFVADLAEEGTLTVVVKARKGESLLPTLALLRPDGTPVPLSAALLGEGTGKVSVRNLPVDETGTWGIRVAGKPGTSGVYDLQVKSKAPRKAVAKGTGLPPGQTVVIGVAGETGGLLSFTVRERGGPSPVSTAVVDPSGAEVPGAAALVVRKGTKVSARNVPLAQGFGRYGVRLVGDASGPADLDVIVKVKPPRVARRRVVLGPEPVPQSASPSSGVEGTVVTLSGQGFQDGARVLFGDAAVEVPAVEFESPATLRFPVPEDAVVGPTGTVEVGVQNPDGQVGSLPSSFTYLGRPVVTAVSPDFSPLAGGNTLTLTGRNFRPGASVEVGGNPATAVTVVSGTRITCTAPAHAAGTAPVVVTDEFDRAGNPFAGHEYAGPPSVTAAAPAVTPSHGGRTVTLAGTGFRPGLRVLLDGEDQPSVAAEGPATASFTTTAGAAGPVLLEVRDPYGQSSVHGEVLARGPSFHAVPGAVPAKPAGTDFFQNSLALGDLDGDGDLDLAATLRNPPPRPGGGTYPATRILRNDGTGTFVDATAASLPFFPETGEQAQGNAATLGDLDGDEAAELVITRPYPLYDPDSYPFSRNGKQYAYYVYYYGSFYPDYLTYLGTRVLAGAGSGALADASVARLPDSGSTPFFRYGERWQGWAHALGDLDGDGDLDLVVTAARTVVEGTAGTPYPYNGITYLPEYYDLAPATRVLRNDGTGAFAEIAGAVPGPYAYGEDFDGVAVALGDLDGDDRADLVVVRDAPLKISEGVYYGATRVLRNDGGTSGTFTPDGGAMPEPYAATRPGNSEFWQGASAVLADLDGDGHRDLVLGKAAASYWTDGTGKTHLQPAIRVFRNDGSGNFAEATGGFLPDPLWRTGSRDTILSVRSIQVGDLDGDDDLDLVTAGTVYYVYDFQGSGFGYNGILPYGYRYASRVLINDGAGGFTDATADWMPAPVNGDWFMGNSVRLGDLDGDGDPDLALGSYSYPDTPYRTTGHNRALRVFLNK